MAANSKDVIGELLARAGKWKPDRNSPVPLYLQIRQQLVALIGAWPDPELRFFTDEELTRHFGVAKATVRQALSDLSQSGLLRRRRGNGTFVVRARHVEQLTPVLDIERQYELAGATTTSRIHAFETRVAAPDEARALRVPAGTSVVSVRRVRSLAHVPIAIDDRVMTTPMAAALNFTERTAAASIVDRVRRKTELGHASWQLEARLAGELDAILLQISAMDPILARSLVYFAADGTPILAGETRHRSDMVRCGFEMDLASEASPGDVRSWTREALLDTAASA